MADQLQVRLVTPDRELVNTAADAVELPGKTGYLEVLYGAAPLLTELGTGLVTIHGGSGGDDKYYVAWGFAEVLPNRVTILAESAEKPEEIDSAAAQQEMERGQKMWNEAGENAAQYERANELMHDAESRLNAKVAARVKALYGTEWKGQPARWPFISREDSEIRVMTSSQQFTKHS